MSHASFLAVVLPLMATPAVVALVLFCAGRSAEERLELLLAGEPVLYQTGASFRSRCDRAVPLRGRGLLALTETRLIFVMCGWAKSDLVLGKNEIRGVRSGGWFERLVVVFEKPNRQTVEFQWSTRDDREWERRIGHVLASRGPAVFHAANG